MASNANKPVSNALMPVEDALAAVAPEAKVAAEAVKAVATAITGSAQAAAGFAKALSGGVQSGIHGAAAAANQFGDSVIALAPGIGIAAKAIGTFTSIFGDLVDASVGFVSKASPATVMQFTRASDDLVGTIGQKVIPVVELLTDGVRLLGDTLMTVLPSAEDFRGAFSPIKDLFTELRGVVGDFAPLIGGVFKIALNELAGAIRLTLQPLISFTHLLGDFHKILGISTPLRSSVGAAVGSAQFQSVEGLGRDAMQKAFSALQKSDEPTQAQVPGLLQALVAKATDVVDKIDTLIDTIKNPASAVKGAVDAAKPEKGGAVDGFLRFTVPAYALFG